MRAFNFTASACIVLALLCSSTYGLEDDTLGTSTGLYTTPRTSIYIDEGLKDKAVFTEKWNFDETTHRASPPIEGSSLIGMILGFGATFIFFTIAVILIVRDEIIRHHTYEKLIERDIRRLKTDCDQTDE